jgi:hypothetical protein
VLSLYGSTVSGNVAGEIGGGLWNWGNASLVNVTVSGNVSQLFGGGGINNIGTALLTNVTLSHNAAPQGGALYMVSGYTAVLTNTILGYSASGGNCYGTLTLSKFTFSSDNSCGLPSGNTIHGFNPNGLDPLLTALGNYGGPTLVHMPKIGSPAIAGIIGNDAPGQDQRGQPRPGSDGSYDIGAVERQPGDSDLAPRLYLPTVLR